MKARSQRTHFMGNSNRQNNLLDNKNHDLFLKSHFRSISSLSATKDNKGLSSQTELSTEIKDDPFKGTHSQLQSLRFDKNKMKIQKRQKAQSMTLLPIQLSAKPNSNEKIIKIKKQFSNKQINMHKLNQLKHIFMKNNNKRKNLLQYYNKFAVKNVGVTLEGLQNLAKEYGYNLNNDQAKIIIRLNQIHNKSEISDNEQCLQLTSFINLMTKQNVYFETLNLNTSNEAKPKFGYKFKASQFQILRNKFHQLKQALNIYKGQSIDKLKFDNVMKKLDINDLVINEQQRNNLFLTFSQDNNLNAQKFLGNIAQQQHQRIKNSGNINLDSSFIDQIQLNKQRKFHKKKSLRQYDFGKTSVVQFQRNLQSAKQIIKALRNLKNKKNNLPILLCGNKEFTSKKQLVETVQNLLQKQGFNFSEQEYSSFGNFINYDHNNQVSNQELNLFIFKDQKPQIMDRLDRRKRKLPPQFKEFVQANDYNLQLAMKTLTKIKQQKLNPENNKLFKEFDKNFDGYLTEKQLKSNLEQFSLDKNQLQNFINYMNIKQKGYFDQADFNSKINPKTLEQQTFTQKFRSKSSLDWNSKKHSFIAQQNKTNFMVPTKFSAWPLRLYNPDFSLIQVPSKSGMHIQEKQRFYCTQKNSLGLQNKHQRLRLYENKLKRIAKWNNIAQERVQLKQKQFEAKALSKTYNLRLLKENYQAACHGKIQEY